MGAGAKDLPRLTVRVDERTREQLKAHAYLTGEAINETVGRLVSEYLAGPGREAMTEAADKNRVSHVVALKSLAPGGGTDRG